jgi:hypothetical protein
LIGKAHDVGDSFPLAIGNSITIVNGSVFASGGHGQGLAADVVSPAIQFNDCCDHNF